MVLALKLSFAVADNEFIFIAGVSMAFLHAYLYPDEQMFCRPPRGLKITRCLKERPCVW